MIIRFDRYTGDPQYQRECLAVSTALMDSFSAYRAASPTTIAPDFSTFEDYIFTVWGIKTLPPEDETGRIVGIDVPDESISFILLRQK